MGHMSVSLRNSGVFVSGNDWRSETNDNEELNGSREHLAIKALGIL